MPVLRQQVEQEYSSDSQTWDPRYSDQRIGHNRKSITQTLTKIINPVIKKIGKIRQPLATLSSSFTKAKNNMLLDLSLRQTDNGNFKLINTASLSSTSTVTTENKDILDASTINRISVNNSSVTIDDTSSIISTKSNDSEADGNIMDNVVALH